MQCRYFLRVSSMNFLLWYCSNLVFYKTLSTGLYTLLSGRYRCCNHSTGIFQRLPKTSHQGRWNNCWSQRSENHQWAYSCCHCIWLGQKRRQRAKCFNIRPWWWHFRCVDFDYRGWYIRSQVYIRWHASRRRGLRQPDGESLRRGIQEEAQERYFIKQTCLATAQNSLWTSEKDTVEQHTGMTEFMKVFIWDLP